MIAFGEDISLYEGDCRELLASLPGGSVDAVVTDPPYELGFMGRQWDSTGIAFDIGLWREVLRVLKPGGHALVFAASRTYHRLACAMEDAGFEIRDQIDWVYSSGMPHGSDVSLLIDRELGAERTKVIRHDTRHGTGWSNVKGLGVSTANGGDAKSEWDVFAPATEQGKRWAGWNSGLKPAHEPICLARKPLDGTLAHNLLEHGTGALHVDACRIPIRVSDRAAYEARWARGITDRPKKGRVYDTFNRGVSGAPGEGRFPPNMLFDEPTARELDRQSGVTVSRKGKPRASVKHGEGWGMTHTGAEYDDRGGASRSFPVFRYASKAKPSERPEVDGIIHPTVKPVALMRWLVRLVTPEHGLVLEPFAGSGATLEACAIENMRCTAAELNPEYVKLIRKRFDDPMQSVLF